MGLSFISALLSKSFDCLIVLHASEGMLNHLSHIQWSKYEAVLKLLGLTKQKFYVYELNQTSPKNYYVCKTEAEAFAMQNLVDY